MVNVCMSGGCSKEPTGTGATLDITVPLTEVNAVLIFGHLKAVRILEFTSMLGVFAGFEDEANKMRFQRRVREYGGIWCCVFAHPVRHCTAARVSLFF